MRERAAARGVRDADLVIAATADDEVNLVCSLMAKKLGAKHTVARVRNPEYFRDAPILRREIGLDMIINPEYAAAQEIARILRVPAAFSVESFARGTVELIGFQITEQDGMAGKSLIEYNKLHPNALLLCAAKRGGEVLVPNGHFVPQAGDRVYAIGTPTETARVLRSMGRDTSPIRQLSVIGGGRIALYLAWALDGMGMHITIVEQNEEKCMAIAEKLPKATILHGDGTDHDLLESEGHLRRGCLRLPHRARRGESAHGAHREGLRRCQGPAEDVAPELHRAGARPRHRHRHLPQGRDGQPDLQLRPRPRQLAGQRCGEPA